jgi:hypothetical protein
MSGSGAGHVRPTSLEPELGAGYVWSGDLVTEELGYAGHIQAGSWTCPENASGTWLGSWIDWVNPG